MPLLRNKALCDEPSAALRCPPIAACSIGEGHVAANFDAETELWKLANIVTGFAVAQGIAFAFALGNPRGST